jgi:hypothetical protein
MVPLMTFAPKIALSLTGLAFLGLGGVLWAQFGSLVYFDMAAAAFMGCFF